MAFSSYAETEALKGIVGDGNTDKNNWISLHTTDPTDQGGGEISGGTYGRMATNWNTPANSTVSGTAVTLSVPSGTTIAFWGVWSAQTGGSFVYGGSLPGSGETFGSNGTYSLTPTFSASD